MLDDGSRWNEASWFFNWGFKGINVITCMIDYKNRGKNLTKLKSQSFSFFFKLVIFFKLFRKLRQIFINLNFSQNFFWFFEIFSARKLKKKFLKIKSVKKQYSPKKKRDPTWFAFAHIFTWVGSSNVNKTAQKCLRIY
jgi:hypothetical protein